jgi:glycopeptide antibiotics resistance protein
LLSRSSDVALINLQLGKIDDYSVLTLIGNMLMFLPVSYLMKYLYKIKTMYTILFISISIIILEVLQYILRKGCLDINDIILNIFGAVLGVVLYNVVDRNRKLNKKGN